MSTSPFHRRCQLITDFNDFVDLHIIDWSRGNSLWGNNPHRAMKVMESLVVGKMTAIIADVDITRAPRRTDWPNWQHAGDHETLAHSWWDTFYYRFGGTGSLMKLADAPDFGGELVFPEDNLRRGFWGDIGQASVGAFFDALRNTEAGDLWITIVNEQSQVVLESQLDLREHIFDRVSADFQLDPPPDRHQGMGS